MNYKEWTGFVADYMGKYGKLLAKAGLNPYYYKFVHAANNEDTRIHYVLICCESGKTYTYSTSTYPEHSDEELIEIIRHLAERF